jgi:hypothetical protein
MMVTAEGKERKCRVGLELIARGYETSIARQSPADMLTKDPGLNDLAPENIKRGCVNRIQAFDEILKWQAIGCPS